MLKVLQKLRRARDEHADHEAHCMSLCCARSGQTVCVSQLVGECHEAACLRDLGLCEGATVTVLRHGETLLVRTGDARFGIGRKAAENVMCDLVETS